MLAERPVGLCVAADHEEIAAAVRSFGGDVRMTSPDCASGTDRVAEVARHLDDVDILVNVQGDEPELAASSIDRVIELLEENPQMVMSTLATPIRSRAQLDDPACVKVVFDARGRALYFSRSPIPHARAMERRPADGPIRRLFISTSVCTRIVATSCCGWPIFRARRWKNSRVSSNFGCLKTAMPIARGRGRRADRGHRYARGLPGVCQALAFAVR